ncbi:DUF1742-domain-containing protein [Peniophora sp. CONT]|nr:DUF1742-domain-containing protein [Peniophora sp. CONT]
MATSFTNVYFKRTAGTPRACYVCHKPTPTVLATAKTVDFIYACDTHLSDPGFATRISDISDATAEAIAKVKEEYDAAQKAKKKAADKGKEQKGKEGKEGDGKETDAKDARSPSPSTPGALTTASPGATTPKHEKYALHRHIFSMRQDDHRRRRQASEARSLAPRLPGAPSGGFSS